VDDRPFVVERPEELRRRWDQCAVSGLDRTRGPEWALERWKALRDLIVGWYGLDDPHAVGDLVETRVGWMDAVQRLIVERQFGAWRAMFPRDPTVEVDLDPPAASVIDHERRVELRVRPTFGFRHADGSEWVRLRTGRSFSSVDEAAVLALGGEEGIVLDAVVGAGVAEEVVSPDDPAGIVSDLMELATRGVDRHADRHTGPWCFSCSSSSRCGAYPLVEPGRVYVSTRSLNVSKTQLGWLDTCQRRVAWDRLYAVRPDIDDEIDTRSAATGIVFHEMAAAAAVSDDPGPIVGAACRGVAPSEAAELQRLWANHERLWADEGPPSARMTEFPAGVSFLVPGVHIDRRGRRSKQPVAITMIGILDLTGRERDGTPMVVEHRTGASTEHRPLELDLYALSTAEYIRARTGIWPARVAVHLHALGPEEPECTRTVLTPEDVAVARERLEGAARTVASWDPENTLDPPFSAGRWCDRCHHREICETYR